MPLDPSNPLQVTVAGNQASRADAIQTQALLDSTWTGEYYHCPQCSYQTLDKALMISHIAEEINTSLSALAATAETAPTKREE